MRNFESPLMIKDRQYSLSSNEARIEPLSRDS
jgi:hypothetical protein